MENKLVKAISECDIRQLRQLFALDRHSDKICTEAVKLAMHYRHVKIVMEIFKYILNFRICNQNKIIEIVKYLIYQGVKKEDILVKAAFYGSIETVKYIVSEGVDMNSHEIRIALEFAAEDGDIEIVKYLIYQGARTLDQALKYAAQKGQLEIVKYLISEGANVNNALRCTTYYGYIILGKYINKEMYKGPINDQTETDCGICLTELNTKQKLIQCQTCKKCLHYECYIEWEGKSCVYCRN